MGRGLASGWMGLGDEMVGSLMVWVGCLRMCNPISARQRAHVSGGYKGVHARWH
jgi:hypothetical protein